MVKRSAGILVYRKKYEKVEVLLVHPGGPFWRKKDKGVWSIPKGEIKEGQNQLDNAVREFEEETGLEIGDEDKKRIFYLGDVRSKSKVVSVYALEKDFGDEIVSKSNLIEVEWPPRSGKLIKFPEVDKVSYFGMSAAYRKLVDYQKPILERIRDIAA